DVTVRGYNFEGLHLPLLGKHQALNCATALCAIRCLQEQGLAIRDNDVKKGVRNVQWPGRFHIVKRKPLIIIDGAHNADGVRVLCDNLRDYVHDRKIHVIFSAFLDKDIIRMVRLLSSVTDRVSLISMHTKRLQDIRYIKKVWMRYLPLSNITVASDMHHIIKPIMEQDKTDDVHVVCGSLYLAGEVFSELGIKPFP
ncbi:MAG: cyanophycin synthetase, partial [Chlamydiota bacterium]|nr:cyanophycin synthetase [Chlamydiota bacterium]